MTKLQHAALVYCKYPTQNEEIAWKVPGNVGYQCR